jgi:methionyl-tRNA formyltransferase
MGIVPEYRGAKSEFWALSHGEPHLVGFSIHELVEALDAGAVMHRETLPSPSTSPAQCRAESLKRLGQQLPNIWIQHERGETKPLRQESKGQLYSTPSLSQKIIWALKTGHLA